MPLTLILAKVKDEQIYCDNISMHYQYTGQSAVPDFNFDMRLIIVPLSEGIDVTDDRKDLDSDAQRRGCEGRVR
jgi:hypothetical protein